MHRTLKSGSFLWFALEHLSSSAVNWQLNLPLISHTINDRFNAGVLSLEPDMEDFVEMIASYRNDSVYRYEGQAEQVILHIN